MEPKVFSQPADTGTGTNIGTQIRFAIDKLKEKGTPMSFDDILNYLSCQSASDDQKRAIRRILQRSPSVLFKKEGFSGKGSYEYKSKYGIKNADQLRAYLQKQTHAMGLSVAGLSDGWTKARSEIERLENQHELLVTRTKKKDETIPKMVWQDDPSLHSRIDHQFKEIWYSTPLPPNPDDLRKALDAAGIKPTSEPPKTKSNIIKKDKKKVVRSGGRQTNTHMKGILRDYSHKRK